MTAVAGHLMDSDFPKEYKRWDTVDPFSLFAAPIRRFVKADNVKIAKNLESEIRRADELMIWTDCDREGEHIGSEIVSVCQKIKPNIRVTRARFSAIIATQIHNACRNPVRLDMLQAAAVSVRIDLDLRVGAAMTRFQSLSLQSRFDALDSKVLSYGPCQFPTLGFVVDQYERLQRFIPESFWFIDMSLEREDQKVKFAWKRHRLFDEIIAFLLYEMCVSEPEATVTNVQTKPANKWKPLPLTTVELQKSGSRLLHLTPKTVLDIAEKLYQKGFVSYPRTETDQFDKDFNFLELIEKQTTDNNWGPFATRLRGGEFERPRNGKKNDQAHPPIHPTAHVSNLTGDDKRVYEYITRRFLACCSKNATGRQTTIDADIAGEGFSASGLVVLQRNYLEVYSFDKWEGNHLPDFQIGERFMPSVCELQSGRTSPPKLLTEADLVNLMDKNGIGTDATIAEHIHKIIEREYVMKRKEGKTEYLLPSTLGTGLIEGYNSIGLEKSLSKPHLRRETEHRMTLICNGTRTKQDVLTESLDEYQHVFVTTKHQFARVIQSVGKYLNGEHAPPPQRDPPRNARQESEPDMSDYNQNDRGHNDSDSDPPSPPKRSRGRGRGAAAASRSTSTRGKQPVNSASVKTKGKKRAVSDDDDDDDQYANEKEGIPTLRIPNCSCGLPSVQLVTKKADSPNFGRAFFKCGRPQGEQCQFFQFTDELASGSGASRKRPLSEQQPNEPRNVRPKTESTIRSPQDTVRCKCNLVASAKVSNKDNENKGRTFYVCSKVAKSAQCNFFQWDESDGAVVSQGKHPNLASNYSCFKCGAEGHFSSNCTTKITASSSYVSRTSNRAYSSGKHASRSSGSGKRTSSRGSSRGRGRGRKFKPDKDS